MVLRIWGFWKDGSWVFYCWGMWVSFSDLDWQRWIEILNITRCAARWGGVSTVWLAEAFKNCVSLLVLPWTKDKKLINRFVSEMTESAGICISIWFNYQSLLGSGSGGRNNNFLSLSQIYIYLRERERDEKTQGLFILLDLFPVFPPIYIYERERERKM